MVKSLLAVKLHYPARTATVNGERLKIYLQSLNIAQFAVAANFTPQKTLTNLWDA